MKLVLFGGKGGVGKTTCASAAGVQLAERGCRALLMSADPAHSLSDCLAQQIGPDIRAVSGAKNLWALEASAERLFGEFKEQHGEAIKQILDSGTYLDQADVDQLFSLSIPGLDEVMAFTKLVELVERREYDCYLLDTAPTGHVLRLLAVPQLLDEWIKTLARLRYKYRHVVAQLARREVHEAADDFLFDMKRTVQRIRALLCDPDQCEFVVVTLPEVMAIAETRRLLDELAAFRIPVRTLIVNRVVSSEHAGCPSCRERREDQQGSRREARRCFAQLSVLELLERPYEVRGIARLQEFHLPVRWFDGWPGTRSGRVPPSPPLGGRPAAAQTVETAR